jgi:hypothetical protein
MCGPNGMRQIIATYNLDRASIGRRRVTIHKLMSNGHLLAACPWGCDISSLADLRRTVDWLYNDGK